MADKCDKAPDGKHYPVTEVVEVIIKKRKIPKLVVCCFYCGKIL